MSKQRDMRNTISNSLMLTIPKKMIFKCIFWEIHAIPYTLTWVWNTHNLPVTMDDLKWNIGDSFQFGLFFQRDGS